MSGADEDEGATRREDAVMRRLGTATSRPTTATSRSTAATSRPDVARGHEGTVFKALKWTSFVHSCVYGGLLVCAFAAGKPQPATFVLGLTHGLLWIFMSIACIAASRARIVPLRLAVAVAVLGGIGPFFGSFEFLRLRRGDAQSGEPITVSVR